MCSSGTTRPVTQPVAEGSATGSRRVLAASSRRVLLAGAPVAAAAVFLRPRRAAADETSVDSQSVVASAAAFASARNDTLAFSFEYPLVSDEGRPLTWVTTRDAARYSDAAPLSADARQRIVLELANFKGPLTISLTVGPPPPVLEQLGAPAVWTPQQITAALLADRSTGRVSTGQRVSLAALENVTALALDGVDYIRFETVAQGSPNFVDAAAKTYRHTLGVTASRDGYFYTLTATSPERLWPQLESVFKKSIESFKLLPATGPSYRGPDTPSFAFW